MASLLKCTISGQSGRHVYFDGPVLFTCNGSQSTSLTNQGVPVITGVTDAQMDAMIAYHNAAYT